MKKTIISIVLTAAVSALLLITGCGAAVIGSGNLETTTYDYSGFTNIEAGDVFNLTVVQGDTCSVEITTDDNIKEYVEVKLSGDTLEIGLKGSLSLTNVTLEADITMPEITGINLADACRANVSGFDSSTDFSVTMTDASTLEGVIHVGDIGFGLSDASRVILSGSATNLMARVSDACRMEMSSFEVVNADINLDEASSASLHITGRLDTVITNASSLTYSGDPEMGEVNVSGASSLNKK